MMRLDNGGFLHYSTVDAIFRDVDKKPISMEFHNYCGPMFSKVEGDGGYMPKEDTLEWYNLWKQFEGWWNAKGKAIYGNKIKEKL